MTTFEWSELDQRAVDTARALAADAVQKVGNGHPGTAMSLAPAAYLLYQKVVRNDPTDDMWLGRDRFVLSAGHSSLTQYVQLYLSGYGLEMDDLAFSYRGLCHPGHPNTGTPRTSKSPPDRSGKVLHRLSGAMGSRRSHGIFDPDTADGGPFDHFVYVIAGDGCMQEGVTSGRPRSRAQRTRQPHLYLGRQPYFDRGRHLDRLLEDVTKRYEAYGWHTQHVDWVNDSDYKEDVEALYNALEEG